MTPDLASPKRTTGNEAAQGVFVDFERLTGLGERQDVVVVRRLSHHASPSFARRTAADAPPHQGDDGVGFGQHLSTEPRLNGLLSGGGCFSAG